MGSVAQPRQLSATAYGTVVHHSLQVMETLHHDGREDALEVAQATFAHYWDPENIGELTPPVDEWIARQSYASLARKGDESLAQYYDYLCQTPSQLLGLEINFNIPYEIDGTWHEISGTVDRLSVRKYNGKSYLSIEDFKTGKKPTFLRYNMQFTVYSWATTQREFWDPWDDGDARFAAYQRMGRRGTWVSLKDNKRSDAGWRAERDYERMRVALAEYVRAVELDVYPPTLSGDVCNYCPFRDICCGVPVPDEEYGTP